jgi:hypothetical protein
MARRFGRRHGRERPAIVVAAILSRSIFGATSEPWTMSANGGRLKPESKAWWKQRICTLPFYK